MTCWQNSLQNSKNGHL